MTYLSIETHPEYDFTQIHDYVGDLEEDDYRATREVMDAQEMRYLDSLRHDWITESVILEDREERWLDYEAGLVAEPEEFDSYERWAYLFDERKGFSPGDYEFDPDCTEYCCNPGGWSLRSRWGG